MKTKLRHYIIKRTDTSGMRKSVTSLGEALVSPLPPLKRKEGMLSLYKEILDGKEFSSIEEYNAEILRASNCLEEELGETERSLLSPDKQMLEDLGVVVKGFEDDSN